MLINPVKDFISKASIHAKEDKLKQLNYMEAELIMLEEDVIRLKMNGLIPDSMNYFQVQINELKRLVRKKKGAV